MRIGIMASVVGAGMLMGGTALADDAAVPSGIEVGLRAGYAIALGNVADQSKMSDSIGGAIPIWIDAGYRLASPNLFLGAYFQYGIGMVSGKTSDACKNGVSCSASVLQYGIQAHYHIMPDATFDPWVGLGIGLENANLNVSASGQSASQGVNGIDFAILQLGGDYHVMPALGIGPVIMFGLGQYSGYSASQGGQSSSGSFGSNGAPNASMHEWLTIAIRGVYDISL